MILFVVSCDVTKKAVKSKTESDFTEQIITKTTRVGDTVSFEVPNVFLKDTTIYTYNYQGTRIETRYNDQGQIDLINCMTSNIDQLIEENRRLTEVGKIKTNDKEKKFNSEIILYGFMGLVAIAFVLSKMKIL